MTAGGLLGGAGYKYQSPTMRSLGKITPESYDYRDQTKLLSKLVGDVSLMGGQMRKMQRGIDEANQNFVQQLQSMITDFFVLLGGGGDTGLDFGDLKYILQAIGALFGFGDGVLPINLFSAAWHFFSTYILPVGNFEEAINQLIDNFIATVLDIFGEVPILGQALQQLAVIISEIRDLLGPVAEALQEFFDAFNLTIGDTEGIGGLFGPFGEIVDAIFELFDSIPVPDVASSIVTLLQLGLPLILALAAIIRGAATFIKLITGNATTGEFADAIAEITSGLDPDGAPTGLSIVDLGIGIITHILDPTGLLGGAANALLELFEALVPGGTGDPLTGLVNFFAGFLTGESPLNALNIFNISNILGSIGIGNLSTNQENLLDNSDFRTAISLIGGGAWTYDDVDGKTVPGSATTTANNVYRLLRSNAIKVAEDDELDIGISVKWSGLSYTGTNPIKLQIVELVYNNVTEEFVEGATVDIAAPTTPGTNQATWLDLLDDYVVPAGVTHICVQLYVGSNASAGTIKFDDGIVKKTGGIQMSWVTGLLTLFGGLVQGIPIIEQIVEAMIGIVGGDLSVLGTIIQDFLLLLGGPSNVGTGTPSANPIARIPIIGGLLNGLFGGFTGIFDQDADQALVGEAAEGIGNTITGVSAGLAQLTAALSPGNPDSDDFERSNSGNWGSGWLVMEDGNGGNPFVDGHAAVWEADYGGDSEVVCRRLTKVAVGQNQTTSVVLGSTSGAVTDGNAAVDLWLRMSEFTTHATRTGMRARFWGSRDIELAWFDNGTKVWSTTGSTSQSMSNGTNLTFQAGEGLNPRRFILKVNNQPAIDFVEAGTASSLTNTSRGCGARGEFSLLFFPPLEMQPGKLKQWTATG